MRPFHSLIILVLLTVTCVSAQLSDPQVRNGTTFVAFVNRSVRASHAKPGDRIDLRVAQAFLFDGQVVPKGAKILGHVVVARRVNKEAKLDSLLAIVADQISWKKNFVTLSAWVVGFGSVKFLKGDARGRAGSSLDRRMMAQRAQASGGMRAPSRDMSVPNEVFTIFDPEAGITNYDSARTVKDYKLLRKPRSNVGTMLIHDDGDVYLPKDLLLLMEQIDSIDPS